MRRPPAPSSTASPAGSPARAARPSRPSTSSTPGPTCSARSVVPPPPPERLNAVSDQLRAEAVIDLDAIAANVAALDAAAGDAAVMAVVKAEGYGHGMVP